MRTKQHRLTAAALFAAACLASTAATAAAQEFRLEPAESRPAAPLSLRSQRHRGDAPAYRPLSGRRCETSYDTYFRRLDSRKPEEGARRIMAVSFGACLEGGHARLTIKLHRGERFYESEELVDVVRLREGEEFAAEKLRAHGIEPYVFGVVKRLRSSAAPPRVENLTQSIRVAGVEVDENAAALRIRLRDVSGRKVTAVQIAARRGRDSLGYYPKLGREGRPVIDTGETCEITYLQSAVGAAGGASVTQFPDTLVIESVLFADGGYEGSAGPAATAAAHLEGDRLQLARVVALLDDASGWPAEGARAAPARLMAMVEALDSKADDETVEGLKRRFTELTAEQREALRGAVEVGMHWLRAELLAELKKLSNEAAPADGEPKFAGWLRAKREALAEWRARL